MGKTLTLEEATEQVHAAEAKYRNLESALGDLVDTPLATAERAFIRKALREEFDEAGDALIAAAEQRDNLRAEHEKRRQRQAASQLAQLEPKLVAAVANAEAAADVLVEALASVIDLGYQHRSALQAANGSQSSSLVPPTIEVGGWVRHRLSGLRLPDLYADRYHRHALADLLLNSVDGEGDDDEKD